MPCVVMRRSISLLNADVNGKMSYNFTQKETERELLPVGSLPRWPHWQGPGAGQNSTQVSPVGRRVRVLGPCSAAGGIAARTHSSTSAWDVGTPGSSLVQCSTTPVAEFEFQAQKFLEFLIFRSSCFDSTIKENRNASEIVKTVNLLLTSLSTDFLWDYMTQCFEQCFR